MSPAAHAEPSADQVPIPPALRPYAEVVLLDGVAHRPAHYQVMPGAVDPADGTAHVSGTRPACLPRLPWNGVPERCTDIGAGWAHHLGYPGCAACWPDEHAEQPTTETTGEDDA